MHIVFTINDDYSQHCAACLKSVVTNNNPLSIFFHVISGDLSSVNQKQLTQIAVKPGARIRFYRVDEISEYDLVVDGHAHIANYFRLFLPSLLPDNLKKVLYLDVDTIVNGKLEPLWQIELGEAALAAVSSPNEQVTEKLDIPAREYINSGVMVINLEYWRKGDVTKETIKFLQENKEIVTYWDQDAINKVLSGKIKYIDPKWNDLGRRPTKNGVIRHFAGFHKPWSIHYAWNSDKALYFKYLLKTPFRSYLGKKRWKYMACTCFFLVRGK